MDLKLNLSPKVNDDFYLFWRSIGKAKELIVYFYVDNNVGKDFDDE